MKSLFWLVIEGTVFLFVMGAQAFLLASIRGIERTVAQLRRLHVWASARLDARVGAN